MNTSRPSAAHWSRRGGDPLPGQPKSYIFLQANELSNIEGLATISDAVQREGSSDPWGDAEVAEIEKRSPFSPRSESFTGLRNLGAQLRCARKVFASGRQLRHSTAYLPAIGSILTVLLLGIFAFYKPKRLVLTFSARQIHNFSRSPIRRWLAKRLISHATRISTLTADIQVHLLEHFPNAAEKILLTPGALWSDFVIVSPRYSAPRGKIVVLTVGRLHPRYGQLITLAALQTLPEDIKSRVEYWIVGRGSKVSYVEKLRHSASMDPSLTVRFFGNITDEELADVYDGADIFALTAVNDGNGIEGFGQAHVAASERGLPIVAHDVGEIPEAVRCGAAGYLVSPNRPSELSIVFEGLIRCRALRRRLGEAGRDAIQRRQSGQDTATVLEPLFDDPSANFAG